MFAEGEWDDISSAETLTPSAIAHVDSIKEGVSAKVGKKKSLLKTLQTLGSAPEPDWSSCPAPEGSDSEADEPLTKHPKKKKKRIKKRKRGQQANSQDQEKDDGDQAGDEIPRVVKKQKLSPQIKASKNDINTKVVTEEQKEGTQENEGTNNSIEKALTRKQWKSRMKNKRKCKNKYRDKVSQSETEQLKKSDKDESSTPKQMDPSNVNTVKSKSKKARKSEARRLKYLEKKNSISIPPSETQQVPMDGLVDISNITNNDSDENLSKPPVKNEPLMPSAKRKMKEKQKHADKLRHILSSQSSEGKAKPVEGTEEKDTEEDDLVKGERPVLDRSAALRSKMEKRLEAARFRYINEILYTTTSSEAKKMFKQDPKAFEVYHLGFTTQVQFWPENPVDAIISFIRQRPSSLVVADFGCGDCKIARSVKNKVHSFDLAPTCDLVTVCDMANVPIGNGTVDIAVFCLSLMGTNLGDFLSEANRVLVMGGVLKIAEVASRFENVRGFIGAFSSLGFKIVSKDTNNNYFYLFEFEKVADSSENIKKAGLTLKPCMYKKR